MWKNFKKTATQKMRDYIPGEDLTGISVADGELPKKGGKIAKDDQGSQWYISPEFMASNYEELGSGDGLELKYFVLKPGGRSHYATASRDALKAYANAIEHLNPILAKNLRSWRASELSKLITIQEESY